MPRAISSPSGTRRIWVLPVTGAVAQPRITKKAKRNKRRKTYLFIALPGM
jgi:hypothetical protein